MTPPQFRQFDQLTVEIHPDNCSLGAAAARCLVDHLGRRLKDAPYASLIVATGNSMLSFYQALCQMKASIDWQRVRVFHLDEYVGMAPDHPASFRRYLREKIIDCVKPLDFFEVAGDKPDVQAECARYAALLSQYPADVCCLGIGENGHLAFNDPPYADFNDPATVKVVRLAEKSRLQQVGEGHFASLDAVPRQAITLTIPALLKPAHVIAIVPEARKAAAVQAALLGEISEQCPASILRRTPRARLFLDADSAALLPVS